MSSWKVGDVCEGQFSEDEQWYTARIDQVIAPGKYYVTYTEYGNGEETEDQFLRPKAGAAAAPAPAKTPEPESKFKVGQTVLGQFSEDNVWYVAEVITATGKNYHLKYTEYGNEEDRTEEFIKELPNWKVGDKVQAQFSEDGVFYEAEIKSIKDGLYHVLYTEFGNEEDVGIAALKESANPAAVAAVSAPAPVAAAPVVEESSGWGAPAAASTGFGGFSSGFGGASSSFGGGDSAGATPRDTLVVRGLSYQTNEDSLRALFEPFGSISRCNIAMDRDTGKSKGVGFVQFDSIDDAGKALEGTNGQDLDGRSIRVEYSEPRSGGSGAPRSGGSSRPPPPLAVKSEAEMNTDTVFLGRLSYDTTEDSIRPLAEKFGRVVSCRITKDKETGASKGSAYVQYPDKDAVERAVKGLHGQPLDGRTINADWARPSREFDPNKAPEPFTPKPSAFTAGGSGFGSSSSASNGFGGFGAAPAAPAPQKDEVFDPKVLSANRKVIAQGSSFKIVYSFESLSSKSSSILSHMRH